MSPPKATRFRACLAGLALAAAPGVLAEPDSGDAVLNCLSGTCYLKRRGSTELESVEGEGRAHALLGDTAITVGEGSLLEIDLGPRGGQAYLRGTGLTRVQEGRDRVLISSPGLLRSAPSGVADDPPPEDTPESDRSFRVLPGTSFGNLSFFRDLPITLLSPRAGDPVLMAKFPSLLRLVFRLSDPSRRVYFETHLRRWALVPSANEASSPAAPALFELEAQGPAGNLFLGNVEVEAPGTYRLVPSDQREDPNQGLELKIIREEELSTAIDALLKSADPQGGVELRTD